MTSIESPSSPSSPRVPGGLDSPTHHRRGGAVRFVAVFVVVVLGLLAGYRFAISTFANDWYLFQVARHTCWVLDLIGYRADLEKTMGGGLIPAEARTQLYGPGDPRAADSAPLSPWETWQYRAWKRRHSPDQSRVVGPQVFFVWRPGIQHQVEALEAQAETLPAPPADSGQREAIIREIQDLRKAQAAGAGDPVLREKQQGQFFSFIVIPECGAIEVMVIFLAAVLAFPARWLARLGGLAAGLPIMYMVNILRLSCLAWIGAVDRDGAWFEFFHEYVWQAVYVVFVVMVWMAWVELGVRRAAR